MKSRLLFSILLLFIFQTGFAQQEKATKAQQDSIKAAQEDSIKMAELAKVAIYPLFKEGLWSGVIPVQGVTEIPNPKDQYNLLFEFTMGSKDTTYKELNEGLVEIARIVNLHIASGIPISHIHAVVLTHGPSLFSIMNDAAFREKFKKADNPNTHLIDSFMRYDFKFIACGQAMAFFDVPKDQLHKNVKISLTAQTALSAYANKGYVHYDISKPK